jgi:hypothetical protein
MRFPKTSWSVDSFVAALVPTDEAVRNSEIKWGCGRLERLVSPALLEAYRRGWALWRAAVESGDLPGVQSVGPKMIEMLRRMDADATASGAQPLSVDTWEADFGDGRVLVLCRTTAEASEVARTLGRAVGLGLDAALPCDLLRLVEAQRAGRQIVVWTMGELARVLPEISFLNEIKATWPGATITSGPATGENDAHDWATKDPIRAVVEGVAE